jgi:Ca2+-binding RTX toxin-like protein
MQKNPYGQNYKGDNHTFRMFKDEGDDKLYGEAGNDNLFGQSGDDILYGGDGDDYLIGFTANNEAKQKLINDVVSAIANDFVIGGIACAMNIKAFQ